MLRAMMAVRDFVRQIDARLGPLADPQRAPQMAFYMKNRFTFLGIQTPVRRDATAVLIRSYDGDPLEAVEALWRLDAREYQYVGCDLLDAKRERLTGRDLPRLARLVRAKSWWDTVDGLAKVAGDIVRRERKEVRRMDAWIEHPDLWLRRVALLHQLQWKGETDHARLFRYCLKRAGDAEFFIRKAIGWALRQYSWTEPQAVRGFLATHGAALAPLSIREASKRLARTPRRPKADSGRPTLRTN